MSHAVEPVLRRLGMEFERRGRRWWARCPRAKDPRHHPNGDRDWSCSVMPNEAGEQSGLVFCHACKFGGNLQQLVAKVLGLKDEFASTAMQKANEWLARDATQVKPVVSVNIVVGPLRRRAFVLPKEILFGHVDDWPESLRRYVLDDRRLTRGQIERWGIGYAVEGLLAGRVVLVTRDARGVPVNYSARAVGVSKKRYLMADGRDGADRRAIFGEQHWASAGRTLVLTEGAFDALAVERVVPEDVAVGALSGSNVTPNAIARLARFDRFVIATDADVAGKAAASKLRGALVRTKDVRRLVYPTGQDANSMDPEALRDLIRGILSS
jgi:hypothetical protein